MSDRRSDLDAELRRLVDENHGAGDHASPEDLIAYHQGSLSEARAEELREHLARCSECMALLLEYDEHWADGETTPTEAADEPWHRRPGPLRALAAVLAALVLGLAAWIATHGPEAGSDSLAVNLAPSSGGLRGGAGPPLIEVPERVDRVVLILDVAEVEGTGPEMRRYSAALRLGSELVAAAEGVSDEIGQLTLIVPASRLRPGEYEVVVSGSDAEPKRVAYRFRVARRGAAR